MTAALGAVLLIAGGAYAGFYALECTRTAFRFAEMILEASRDMRTEILCHRTPLPVLMERLGSRYPRVFPQAENASALIREFSFHSVWTASMRCAALPKPLEGPLLRLGEQLSSGADPEQALDAHEYCVLLTEMFGNELAVFFIELPCQSPLNIINMLANLSFSQYHLSF